MSQTENQTGKEKSILKKLKTAKWVVPVSLGLLIALQIGYMCFIFFTVKTSYHCDEIYSYGLANNFFGAYLESDEVYTHEEYNSNEWISADIFRNYLTVQPSERFRYDSVWYNQSKDRHPPLYYSLIHTISSFMPDQFSFVPGFILNLVFFVVTQIFLYLLSRDILRSRYLALLLCFFWGFTAAALDMTVFIRMYCMLTMWSVILIYLHSRLYKAGEKPPVWLFITLGAVTMLGGLTQYLFYFVAFFTAVVFCIHYLINRRFRLFLIYGSTMLLGVGAAFVIYLPSFRQIFSEGSNAVAIDFFIQLPIALRYITSDIFRLTEIDLVWFAIAVPPILLIAVLMALPLLFLFRKNEKLRNRFRHIKGAAGTALKKIKGLTPSKIWNAITKADPIPFAIFVCILMVVIVVSYTVSFITGYCSRYFYIIMPLFVLLVMLIAKSIFRGKAGKIIITAFAILLAVRTVFFTPVNTFWTDKPEVDFRSVSSGSNVSIIYSMDYRYDDMSTFSYELYKAEKVFYTTSSDVLLHEKELAMLDNDKPIYVMVYQDGHGTDEKGEYVLNISDIDRHIYISDLLRPYQVIDGVKGYEYIGEYKFVKGDFLVFKVR